LVECTEHIMACPNPNRQDVWMEVVDGLADWFVLTKTDPEIAGCICNMVRWQDAESKFSNHAELLIVTVAAEQDMIGWLSFTEGRILTWAQGLIQQLLSVVHKIWIAWNAVVHEWDDNGCLTKERKETEEAIQDQFELEYEDLCPQDWHLMEMGQEMVLHKAVMSNEHGYTILGLHGR